MERMASRVETMTIRQNEQRQRQAGGQDALTEAEGIDEDAERQQAIDDGRQWRRGW